MVLYTKGLAVLDSGKSARNYVFADMRVSRAFSFPQRGIPTTRPQLDTEIL